MFCVVVPRRHKQEMWCVYRVNETNKHNQIVAKNEHMFIFSFRVYWYEIKTVISSVLTDFKLMKRLLSVHATLAQLAQVLLTNEYTLSTSASTTVLLRVMLNKGKESQ